MQDKLYPQDFGEWIGMYPNHGETLCRIYLNPFTNSLECIKTSCCNEYIGEGNITWRVNLATREAEGFIAEAGEINFRSVPAKITVLEQDKIKVEWKDLGAVEFKRYDL